jgi:hypothetical protein
MAAPWRRIDKWQLATKQKAWGSPGFANRQNVESYFTAAKRALRRDLYRPAVFLWITPVFTARSIMETVS